MAVREDEVQDPIDGSKADLRKEHPEMSTHPPNIFSQSVQEEIQVGGLVQSVCQNLGRVSVPTEFDP
jgi:hypothetical protein